MNNSTVRDLKPIIYEIIKAATCSNDNAISATQNLGVNISNSMKKDGVNIIQLQNVNGESIIPRLIDALQLIDKLEFDNPPILLNPDTQLKNISYRLDALECKPSQSDIQPEIIECKPPESIVDAFIKYIDENGFNLRDAVDLIKCTYYDFLSEKLLSKDDALKKMGISKATIYQSRRRLKEMDNE